MASAIFYSPSPNHEALIRGIKSLYNSDWQSDLIIKGGAEKEWKLHTVVICSQSKVFKKAIKAEWQKTKQNVIVLDDEPDLLIDQLVKFLYLGSYDDSFSKTLGSPWGSMQFNIKVLIAADKYDIPDLGDYASQKLLARLPRVNLKNPAGKQDFLHAVYELYQEGPASATKLRDELKEVGISNSHALFADDFKKSDDGNEETLAFHKLIRDVPEFGDQVMVTLSAAFAEKKKDSVGTSTYRCDTCQTQFVMTHGRYDLKVYCPHCKGPAKKLW